MREGAPCGPQTLPWSLTGEQRFPRSDVQARAHPQQTPPRPHPATAAHSCVKTRPRGGVFAASAEQPVSSPWPQLPGNPSFHDVRLSAHVFCYKARACPCPLDPQPSQGKDFGPQHAFAPFLLRDHLRHTHP